MKLRHCRYEDPKEPVDLLQDLLLSPDVDEVFLVVSNDFWEFEDQDRYEEIYDDYYTYFHTILAEIAQRHGPPVFQGRWDEPSYPDWAVGEEIAVWNIDDQCVYLRIHHEDREVPIVVALTLCEM